MTIPLLIILGLFIFSFLLIRQNIKSALTILLILSVFLHKELFSINAWDMLPIRIFMLAFSAYFGLAFVKALYKNRSLKVFSMVKDPFIFILLLLWFVRGVSIIFSQNLTASLSLYAFYTTMTLLGIVLYYYFRKDPELIVSFVKKYIWIAFALCIFGLVQFFLYEKYEIIIGALWNIPGNLPRVGSTFWDVNHFGAFLAFLLPVLCVLILIERKAKNKVLMFISGIPIVILLFLTNSRSAWIMGFVSVIAFASILFIRKFKYKGIATLAIICMLIAFPFFREYSIKSSPFRATVKQYFHYRMDSFDSHFLLLTGAWQIFNNYPILGAGYGGFFEQFRKMPVAPTYFSRDPAALNTRVPPHTIWGEALSETGVVGLTAFTVFILFGLGTLLYVALTYKTKREILLTSAMASSIVGLMAAGVFYSYNSEFFYILLFFYFIYGFGLIQDKISYSTVINYFIRSRPLPIIMISVIAAVLIFVNLGVTHLIPWDEAIYAKVAKNMFQSGNYTTLQWIPGTNWYEKPPLYMWLSSAFMSVLGFESLAPRLPSALFGFGTVLLVYFFGKKLFSKTAGFLSAFVLATTFQFLYYSRAAMLDVTTTFFITLTLFIYYLAREKNKSYLWILAGIFCGLGVMVKDIVGLLPVLTIFGFETYLAISNKTKLTKLPIKGYILFLISAICVFLPWHLQMFNLYGAEFYDKYIRYHILDRATSSIEDKGQPFWWYAIVMKVSMRLWFIVLLIALPFSLYTAGILSRLKFIKETKNKILVGLNAFTIENKSRQIFLLVWMLSIFLFFSSATSKLVWYIIPVYPAAALIVGCFMAYLINRFTSPIMRLAICYLVVCTGLLYLLGNKGLVYTSDLTGSEARLITLKDQTFLPNVTLYYDKVERPLVLYYTDGPIREIDLTQLRSKLSGKKPEETIVFLTKESRFDKLLTEFPAINLIAKDDAWALGSYPASVIQPNNQTSSNK